MSDRKLRNTLSAAAVCATVLWALALLSAAGAVTNQASAGAETPTEAQAQP
jgi:hypothetical protein